MGTGGVRMSVEMFLPIITLRKDEQNHLSGIFHDNYPNSGPSKTLEANLSFVEWLKKNMTPS